MPLNYNHQWTMAWKYMKRHGHKHKTDLFVEEHALDKHFPCGSISAHRHSTHICRPWRNGFSRRLQGTFLEAEKGHCAAPEVVEMEWKWINRGP